MIRKTRVIGGLIILSALLLTSFSAAAAASQQDNSYSVHTDISPSASGVQISTKPLENANPEKHLNAAVTLNYRNDQLLQSYLSDLQDKNSPYYHKYLTRNEFITEFSPTANEYYSYESYFSSRGFTVTAYGDRTTLFLNGTVQQYDNVFHTSIMEFAKGNTRYVAPTSSMWLSVNYGDIAGITGLNTESKPSVSPMFYGTGTSQQLYGSDMQAAYKLNSLYSSHGYPTGLTIATILWAGVNSSGLKVAPFVPSDISQYFNNALPANQPRPAVYGYPISGALPPGPSAANDITQANIESTLDLEMAGSTAPGATLIEVYGPTASQANLDQAFAATLNPSYNSTVNNALSHLAAISNSWGTNSDITDATWLSYEQQAAARGITVLASSGDNGNTNSPSPSFPANVGLNTYGTLAVGGSAMQLNGINSTNGTGTTGILSQQVWYNTPSAGDGSQGGVSSVFGEPSWQKGSTFANSVITGASSITNVASGRGTPDISADAANMLMFITLGVTSDYVAVWGTSIASPLAAGAIAALDNSLGSNEGFMNPLIYRMGQAQLNGSYPGTPPFYIISNGSNGKFSATSGYSLAVGWGSLNAYNLFMIQSGAYSSGRYNVTFTEAGLPAGTSWYVNVSGNVNASITGTSYTLALSNGTFSYSAGTSASGFNSPGGTFTVSGSDMNIALSFARPIFPVTFTASGLPSGALWYVNITGYHSVGTTLQSVSVELVNGTYSYSIGSSDKSFRADSGSFSVQGHPLHVNLTFYPVEFAAVFSMSGLPAGTGWYVNLSNGVHNFTTGNSITILLTNGTYSYTAEADSALYRTERGSFSILGSNVTIFLAFAQQAKYSVSFNENGLPAGTTWYVNISGFAPISGTSNIISASLANGTYSYTVWSQDRTVRPVYSGTFIVSGSSIAVQVNFIPVTYEVEFAKSGLPAGITWSVNVSGLYSGTISGNYYYTNLTNGTYSYSARTSNSSYGAGGSPFTINGSSMIIYVNFTRITYAAAFVESGLQSGSGWYVNMSGYTSGSISGTTYTFQVPNGTYAYSASAASKKYAPVSGIVTVKGENAIVYVNFTETVYSVTFLETGLPPGTTWYVNTTGYSSGPVSVQSFSLMLPNGTYSYVPGSTDKNYRATAYNFNVSGSPETVRVSFLPVLFPVTFIETGLPQGTAWFLNRSGSISGPLGTSEVTLLIANGTYSYSARTENTTFHAGSGIFTVSGSPLSVNVEFLPFTYSVVFREQGLPDGTSWTVEFSGQARTSTDTSLTFQAVNGSHEFSVKNTTLYFSGKSGSSVTVAGANVTVDIAYRHYSYITGHVDPSDSAVMVNGRNVSLSNGVFNVTVVPGNYSVVISHSGYRSFYSNLSVVENATYNLTENLLKSESPTAPVRNTMEDAIIFVSFVAVTLAIAAYAYRSRK